MTSAPNLSLTQPATQSSTLGSGVSLQVKATTNTGVQRYRASGLPPGLSINSSTGRVTGKPKITAGTFKPRISVSDYAKTSSVSLAACSASSNRHWSLP